MSLINQMLKDLEKRRSRDLETSEALSQNITWESGANNKVFNWLSLSVISALVLLIITVSYLLWERTLQKPDANTEDKQVAVAKQTISKKIITKKKPPVKNQPVIKREIIEKDIVDEVIIKESVDIDVIENDDAVKLRKVQRPLNSKQLAEIEYNKGYSYLQQGRMHQGKEALRKAISLYIPHVRAREMLAGIYIKSGRFINAAELLSEGVKVVPEYPLFAQLYARVLLEQKNPKLAIKILEQGSANMNVEPDYYALLAATYQRVKNHNKAIDVYLQLVKIRPNIGVWWLGLGISLEKSGKNKEALEAYQRAEKTGSLKSGLVKFTNNRVAALQEIGFPEK